MLVKKKKKRAFPVVRLIVRYSAGEILECQKKQMQLLEQETCYDAVVPKSFFVILQRLSCRCQYANET